ncbi:MULTISPECIES: basic amino acid ABC transporter substrate-binding protein [Gulbenkiania]|uniref:ABC-type amino acid transport/signal transduction system, periplasmic component/domain n=2 Tax=Gulbenkiania TaxID=397456 RepID=A0A0K6H267_9NEIS|nr:MULTISPECIES: basic amino acid ABC transporter substrate-binding protein [Gulbenkiania]TCW31308.1 polar amino acid transport system substrate-binding protein [Gulbenkiania mobilis]CUA84844.1 ABC-type amino acid transport/signal transduction system, periplasmic component/domain [Gulbenkiania indica]
MKASRRTLLAGMLVSVFALYGCGKQQSETPAASAEASGAAPAAAEARTYVVGTDASYAPFEFQNDKQEIVGFDVEVLTAAAAKGGFKVRFENTPWEGIFATLAQGDRDLLASAITITDERKQSMDFSEPYFEARQLIAVGKGVTDVKTFQDLKNKKVAVQTGTTGDEVVQKLLGKTNPNIKRFESMPLALKELESGGVEAAVGDNGVVSNYVRNNPQNGIATVEDTQSFAPEYYGFAVKKGNKEMLDKINAGLKAIKEDGTYDAIYGKYFGAK